MIRTLLNFTGLDSQFGRKIWLILILVSVAFVALSSGVDFEGLLRSLPFSSDPSVAWYYGPLGFTLFGTLAICLSCPRQVVSLVAGFFFGLWVGFFAALLATSLSCAITYGLACLMQARALRLVKGRLLIAVDFWKENTFLATAIWRFIPAGSNSLTNIAAGALSVPGMRFVSGSAVGYIPHTLVFAGVGSGLQVESGTQIAVSGVFFLIALVIGFMLVRKYRSKLKGEPINPA